MEYIELALIVIILIVQLFLLFKKPGESAERRLDETIRKNSVEMLDQISREIRALREDTDGKADRLRDSLLRSLDANKDSQNSRSNELRDSLFSNINEFKKTQGDALDNFSKNTAESLEKIQSKVDDRLERIRRELENALGALQSSNERKLDEMRNVVNEKLEKTLETRLQKSFETVSVQLESVNKGLGEMKTVAESVGSLNRVLSNTKTRGILGELQLGQIIEDMLPPQLYDTEVPTVGGSRERVEYAVKLPGVEEGRHVYLPIDSKFPLEDYYRLLDGYEAGDAAVIEASRKALLARVKTFAKDIKAKYISPPDTTNFAVIFLPAEGLYAEITRDPVFFDGLRRDGIVITGPTTLSAMLNSLQIGFKTMQIQRGAADIEKTLGAVKREFENFEGVLNKAHQKITQAGNDIETLVGTRTRAINRSLREVQTYSGDDSRRLIGIDDNEE